MAERPPTLADYFAYYGMTPPGPADYDPRVMDPTTEMNYWRGAAERNNTAAWDSLAAGAVNLGGALGGFAFGSPGAQRTRTILGRWVFGTPENRARAIIGNTVGWGNIGFAGDQGYRAYQRANDRREALEMLNRWEGGQGLALREMIERAFAPRVPGSR